MLSRLVFALALAIALPLAAQDFSHAVTQRLISNYAYAEAPVWSRDGYFLWADVPEQKILKWIPGGQATVFREMTNKVIGAAFDAKGDLYLCESATGRVVRLPAKGGAPEPVASQWQGKRLDSPDSVTVRKDGHVYFTDPAFGSQDGKRELDFYGIYHVSSDSKQPMELIAKPKGRPNGIALSPNGRTLYVANSDEHAVYAYDLSNKGEASNERQLITKVPGVPGGVTTDEKGNIYVAARGVLIYSPEGKLIYTIDFADQPSDMAFGGANFDLLLVTAGPSIYLVELPVKGSVQY